MSKYIESQQKILTFNATPTGNEVPKLKPKSKQNEYNKMKYNEIEEDKNENYKVKNIDNNPRREFKGIQ